MEIIFGSEEFKNTFVETHKNPFQSANVDRIIFWIRKEWSGTKMVYESTVEFKNGNTEGKHSIKADDFVGLVLKTEAFIQGLEKQNT